MILLVFTASLQFQQKENFIAKITVEGIIKDRNDILEQLENLDNDENVKGLITIINSPGGTYVGSKEIHESIKNLSKKKKSTINGTSHRSLNRKNSTKIL